MLLRRDRLLVVLVLMLATPAGADDRAPHHPLKPGKAAGISHAQQIKSGIALVAAGGVVAVVALVAGTGNGGGTGKPQSDSVPVTTGTP